MITDDDSLYLYNLTLKPPTLYISSIVGQFLGEKKSQELLVVTCTGIELWRPDNDSGKLYKITHQHAFGTIQSIDKLRLVGTIKDLLVITADSGKLVVCEFNVNMEKFIPLIQEPHSKNGLRRITPGEYLNIDPQNRCIFLGSIERNKLIYKVLTDEQGKLMLSSPLEASNKLLLTFNTCALDTDFENPIFAAIEIDYSDFEAGGVKFDEQETPLLLNYYEFDQGLNHIIKRSSPNTIPASSNLLIPLPAHIGGLLICGHGFIIYENPNLNQHKRLFLPIPKRQHTSSSYLVNYVIHRLKKNNFFILTQTQFGDLLKITVDLDNESQTINTLTIKYFDTIALSTSLNIFKSGFLYANVTNNSKLYYQFESLGEEDDETTLYSSDFSSLDSVLTFKNTFLPHDYKNLALMHVMDSLDPIIDSQLIETVSSNSPDPIRQLVTLGSHSYLKTLTHGVPSNTVVSSPLPIVPSLIHTCRLFEDSTNDEYLVISSIKSSQTLILSIGEVVEEVNESKFVVDQPTLAVQQVGKASVVQIYSNGIRHVTHTKVKDDIERKTTDWYPPAGIDIIEASTNNLQVIIGLSNREICYFEVDSVDDQLIEYQERLELSSTINSLAISTSFLNKSHTKSSFAVIGCNDETIQVISLHQHNCLEILALQALSANSCSIVMLPSDSSTIVHIGMENGLYVRSVIDEISGKLSDTRTKYLGSKPVKLSTIGLPQLDKSAVLAISSRPWIGYHYQGTFKISPLNDLNIMTGASFYSEDIGGEGIVACDDSDLIIFTIGNSEEDETFNINNEFIINSIKLRYTPKLMIFYESNDNKTNTRTIFTLQTEYGIKSAFPNDKFETEPQVNGKASSEPNKEISWASCIQAINFDDQEITQSLEFLNNESINSMCTVSFKSNPNLTYLVVGTTKDQVFFPNKNGSNYLYCFQIKGKELEFIHKTEIDKKPLAMTEFKGKVLVTMENYIRLYDLGTKQLLRKTSSHIDHLRFIVKVCYMGKNRVVVGDSNNSTVFIRYDSDSNSFHAFSDDSLLRQVTSVTKLDYNTIVGGDKFGNVFVNRLSSDISEKSDHDWNLLKHQDSYLNASSNRLKSISEFYLQDIPTSFMKGSLIIGGKESIVYTGLQGTIGILSPLLTKKEIEFFLNLEIEIRGYYDYNFDDFDSKKKGYNLLGKDHSKFRGYYNPVRNVIDGDLVETFFDINMAAKIKISNKFNQSPREIEKRINDLRERTAF